ncbi:MAG: hypothetical protein Q4G33_08800 [bacterium]|nr:hypothetical protein [bacterium]
MRSCIYCGKELAPGEKCTCRQSAEHRKASDPKTGYTEATSENSKKSTHKSSDNRAHGKNRNNSAENRAGYGGSAYNDPTRTEYRTGYTKQESHFRRACENAKARRYAKRTSGANKNPFGKGFWHYLLNAFRSPVQTVMNPKSMSLWQMVILWAIQGALAWLCIFFITTHTARGPLAILGNLLAFNGINGYKTIMYMLLTILSGAIGGMLAFFLYTGVFFSMGRFIFRDKSTSYSSFCERLALTALPFSVIALIGTALSLISITSLIILLICGAAIFAILTYEALRTQWAWVPADKTLYGVLLGFFVMTAAAGYLIRFS